MLMLSKWMWETLRMRLRNCNLLVRHLGYRRNKPPHR
jgi:hypothetical protein